MKHNYWLECVDLLILVKRKNRHAQKPFPLYHGVQESHMVRLILVFNFDLGVVRRQFHIQ